MSKPKIILIVSVALMILLVALSVAQPSFPDSAYDPNTDFGTLVVKLSPGWNVMPMTGIYASDKGEFNTCGDLFSSDSKSTKAAFIWSPVEGKYLGGTFQQVNKADSEANRVLNRDRKSKE